MTLDEVKHTLAQPVGSVSGLSLSGCHAGSADVVPLLLASGHLAHLTSLDLTATPVGGEALVQLVNSADCARLESLLLGGVEASSLNAPCSHGKKWAAMVTCDVDDEGLAALLASPFLTKLRKLDLSYAVVKPQTWERFASSNLVSGLTHFGAEMTSELSAGALQTILSRATRLEGLGLCCAALGDAGVEALINAPCQAVVRKLELALSKVTLAGARALLNAPFPKLERVDLRGVSIDQALLDALTTRSGTRALKTVVLSEKTSMPTGERDVWYDQGQVVGESEGLFWLYQLDQKPFREAGLTVTSDEARWPRGWLA